MAWVFLLYRLEYSGYVVAPSIVGMEHMRPVQLRNVDLNLLVPLKALLHERNVTRAAERIHLSQSAMSRTLDRVRSERGDELLVRVDATMS